jgi:hypothetical protein
VGAHPGPHLAGPDHQHVDPERLQGLAQAQVEAVQAGLGGAVHEVGPAHPFAGRRTHRDDPPDALLAHPLTEQDTHRNRGGVVDLGDLHRLALVLPQLLGVSE